MYIFCVHELQVDGLYPPTVILVKVVRQEIIKGFLLVMYSQKKLNQNCPELQKSNPKTQLEF